jgi:peptidoglycan/LPS O-acetylase OafA/YrhL
VFKRDPHASSNRGGRVFYLDFIRAISICLIIIYHYNLLTLELQVSDNAILWKETSLGVIGISLFIILSGASLMLSTKEDFNIRTFIKKRFLSIYPLFWVIYATTFLTLVLIHQKLPVNAHPLTFFLTIMGLDGFLLYAIPNFYLLGEWFLGFIIIMYMIFPFLRYLFIKYVLFAFLLCFCITLLVTKFYHSEMVFDRFPLIRLMEFVLGMSFIYLFSPPRELLNFILIGISGLLFSFSLTLNLPPPFNWTLQGLSLFICLACISELFGHSLFAGFIRFISTYSYGAFLIHHVFFYQMLPLLKNHHLSTFNNYLLFFLLLIFIYSLSFLLTNVTACSLRKFADNKVSPSPVIQM